MVSSPLLIRDLLPATPPTTPRREIVSGDARYDYQTLRARIARLASGLAALGVRGGDTVAVMDWDNRRYLECFFAVPMMRAVLHTINIRLSREQILYAVNHAEDDVILAHADFVELLQSIWPCIKKKPKLVLLRDDAQTPATSLAFDADYESLLENPPDYDFPEFDENARATAFYTSGTTGAPKGVTYTHRQLVLHTLGLLSGFGLAAGSSRLHRGDVYMPITPMFHVHAWGFPYAATLLGLKQVYPGRYEPSRLLQLIAREGVTFSHCVPTILHMLLNAPESRDVDLSNWKVAIGGSALPRGLAAAARERGIDVFAAYGLSETCPFLSVADLSQGDDLARRCAAGRPGELVDLHIVDDAMRELPPGPSGVGEIVARAPWLARGYVKDAAASDALWRGGWLHTGDVGYIDAAGVLHITDRIKDVIKSGGEWLSSLELESIVSTHRAVCEVAALGAPDARWGERPMLLVVRAEGEALCADDIRAMIEVHVKSGRLPKWALPERIEFVESLDKTGVGKIDKKKLRAKYLPPEK